MSQPNNFEFPYEDYPPGWDDADPILCAYTGCEELVSAEGEICEGCAEWEARQLLSGVKNCATDSLVHRASPTDGQLLGGADNGGAEPKPHLDRGGDGNGTASFDRFLSHAQNLPRAV